MRQGVALPNDPPQVSGYSPWRLSVAPMLDWTDRHCRYFHRLLSRRARLYTEMVTTGALLHGAERRHLLFNEQEHPVALQLGGSEPDDLARCARLGAAWGYDEINLNCGCPSERVRRGAFGACLMAEPATVADGVKAMCDAVDVPVTVKHRIGIDRVESYDFVRDFVGTVAQAGCRTFIVHARNAWLQGLSPKENREIPPLRPEWVWQLKTDFPGLNIVINGGIATIGQIDEQLQRVDGVMIGREAYNHPWSLTRWDGRYLGDGTGDGTGDGASPEAEAARRDTVELSMVDYMERQAVIDACPWYPIARHMLGLRDGQRGARRWRQVWSDHRLKGLPPREVWRQAQQALAQGAAAPERAP